MRSGVWGTSGHSGSDMTKNRRNWSAALCTEWFSRCQTIACKQGASLMSPKHLDNSGNSCLIPESSASEEKLSRSRTEISNRMTLEIGWPPYNDCTALELPDTEFNPRQHFHALFTLLKYTTTCYQTVAPKETQEKHPHPDHSPRSFFFIGDFKNLLSKLRALLWATSNGSLSKRVLAMDLTHQTGIGK